MLPAQCLSYHAQVAEFFIKFLKYFDMEAAIIASFISAITQVLGMVNSRVNLERQIDYDDTKTNTSANFTREMNDYNSPKAQVERYNEAGINPFMSDLTGGIQTSPANVFQSADFQKHSENVGNLLTSLGVQSGSSIQQGFQFDQEMAYKWATLNEQVESRVQNMNQFQKRYFLDMWKGSIELTQKQQELDLKEKFQNHTISKEEYEMQLELIKTIFDANLKYAQSLLYDDEHNNFKVIHVDPAVAGVGKTEAETSVIKSSEERAKESYEFEKKYLRPAAQALAWSQEQTAKVNGLYQVALMSVYSSGVDSDGNPEASEKLNKLVTDAIDLDIKYKQNELDKQAYIKMRRDLYYNAFHQGTTWSSWRALNDYTTFKINDWIIGNEYLGTDSGAVSTVESVLDIYLKSKFGLKK